MKIFRYIYFLKFFSVNLYSFGHIYVSFSLIYTFLGLFWSVFLGIQTCGPRPVLTGLGPQSFVLKNRKTGTAVPVFSSPSPVQLRLFAVHRTGPLNTSHICLQSRAMEIGTPSNNVGPSEPDVWKWSFSDSLGRASSDSFSDISKSCYSCCYQIISTHVP